MKTDKELLELAAKAVGLKYHAYVNNEFFGTGINTGELETPLWNPLTDDGDALRLAAKLGIGMCFHQGWAQVMHPTFRERLDFDYGDDPPSDLRHAIVRAAAAIGEAM